MVYLLLVPRKLDRYLSFLQISFLISFTLMSLQTTVLLKKTQSKFCINDNYSMMYIDERLQDITRSIMQGSWVLRL